MSTYFISDLHFGHRNVLAFDNRPFDTIEEHDEALIQRWNERVTAKDEVWVLGDISWYDPRKTAELLQRLNGTKRLCIGNHDAKLLTQKCVREQFAEITDYKELKLGDKMVILCHYPIPCFKNHYYGWYHLYGHVHNTFEWNITERTKREMIELYDKECRMYNVGCMMSYMDYTPRTLEEIIQ